MMVERDRHQARKLKYVAVNQLTIVGKYKCIYMCLGAARNRVDV